MEFCRPRLPSKSCPLLLIVVVGKKSSILVQSATRHLTRARSAGPHRTLETGRTADAIIDTNINQVLPHFPNVPSVNPGQGRGQEDEYLDTIRVDGNIDEGCHRWCCIKQRFRRNLADLNCRNAFPIPGFMLKRILEGGGVKPVEHCRMHIKWSSSLLCSTPRQT